MDTTKLKYFLRICEENNVSRAADSLFITQQGLSKSIKSLEEDLKVTLFNRTPKGMILTEYGKVLREHAEKITEAEQVALQDILQLRNKDSTSLQVCFALGVLNSLPLDFMQKFNDKYPNIKLNYIEQPDFICQQAVQNEECCIGVVVGPVDKARFEYEVLKRHNVHALINKNHPLSDKESINLKSLDGEDVILVNEDFQMYHNFIDACKINGIEPNIMHTTGEIFITYKMSSLNKGIGISVDFVSDDLVFSNISSVPINSDIFTWDVTVISKKGIILNSAADTLINFLKISARNGARHLTS